jgi:hypothetical protein
MIGILGCCCCYTGISSFIQCYYTHIQRILVGKNAPKLGIRKRSEIAIFKTIGFEQVLIIWHNS